MGQLILFQARSTSYGISVSDRPLDVSTVAPTDATGHGTYIKLFYATAIYVALHMIHDMIK